MNDIDKQITNLIKDTYRLKHDDPDYHQKLKLTYEIDIYYIEVKQ